jgi:hypothetical protein
MSNTPTIRAILGVLASIVAIPTLLAQSSRFPAERSYTLSGNKPYIVVRGDLNDFTGRRDPAIADFETEADATKAAKALNDALKGDDVFRYLYSWRKRKADEPPLEEPPTPGKGGRIEMPKPKFVDPGPPKKGAKGSVLAGRKGRGKLGDLAVTIEFDPKGNFEITGDAKGNGKWSETETGGVYMESERSTFRGNIKKDTVSGLWFTKDNSRPVTEWSIILEDNKPDPMPKLAGPFRLFLGQFSNTADLRGGGQGQEFPTFAEARARGEKHLAENAGKQPSYRIQDASGKVIEARGVVRNFRAKE